MIPRLIVGIIVVYFLYKLIKGWKAVQGPSRKNIHVAAGEDLVEDPLCHAYVPISNACRLSIDGRNIYFCSQKCLDEYREQRKT
jgi:YHS domain-containing protein